MSGYYRIVLVDDDEFIDYECGEGDGFAAFAAARDKLLDGRKLVSETPTEVKVTATFSGSRIAFDLNWVIRLIHTRVWPFIVSYEDEQLGVGVELFTFYAVDADDAKKKLLAYYGMTEMPQFITITKSYLWVYDSGVVRLKRKRKGA